MREPSHYDYRDVSLQGGGEMRDFVKETEEYLEIEGVKYAKALFREWGVGGMQTGTLFRLISRDDGTITIQTLPDLESENKRLREALEKILYELGVPQPGYPAPVANASDIAKEALEAGK